MSKGLLLKFQSQVVKYRYFYLAIFLRLLLMPFFAHGDIFATYRRAELIAFHGKNLLSVNDPLAHLIEVIFLKFYGLFLGTDYFEIIHSNFTQLVNVNEFLFLFKIPYLLFEVLFWILMFKNFISKDDIKNILFLLFNPVIIYSVYLFGRYETIILFVSALLLVSIKVNKQNLKSILFQGLVMLSLLLLRGSMLLIIPSFLFVKQKFKNIMLSGLIFMSGYGLFVLSNKYYESRSVGAWLESGAHSNYVYGANINIGYGFYLYIFLILLTIALCMIFKHWRLLKSGTEPVITFSLISVLIFGIYYLTSIFHPQYFVWWIPFIIVLLNKYDSKYLWSLFAFTQIMFLTIPFHWQNPTTIGLLFPISRLFNDINVDSIIPIYTSVKIANIGKSILSGTILVMLYELYQIIFKGVHEK